MPAHGGSDSGAVGNDSFEKDYTLKISKYMYDRFKELGVPVYLTRDSDMTLSPTDRVNRVLNAFGDSDDVVVISNHLNAGGGTGAEVIYALRDAPTLSSKILENISDTGQSIRKTYQRRLPSDTSKDYYFMHRNTGDTESVIVEYGFIDDSSNNFKFLEDNYKVLAEAVIKAVLDYKGINYTSPEGVTIGGQASTYTVKKGDSLYSIASKYNTTVNNLKSLNGLTSDILSIGQILKIPSASSTTTYTVKSGDSLYAIANKYNTTVNEIKNLNNLTTNTLTIGQVLKIPTSSGQTTSSSGTEDVSGVINYVVKDGDTLYSISQNYGLNVDDIIAINNITNNELVTGQVIKLPIDTIDEEEDIVIEDNDFEEMEEIVTYTVKSGDTLYSIARSFGVSVDALKEANGLVSNLLSVGQILEIPSSGDVQETTVIYVVKKGDSLYSIARDYNTTVDTLKSLNNLTSNLLSIGQNIIVPVTSGSGSSSLTYTVKSGDSLYSIARSYNTTVDELKKLNNLTSNLLSIGQKLIIR